MQLTETSSCSSKIQANSHFMVSSHFGHPVSRNNACDEQTAKYGIVNTLAKNSAFLSDKKIKAAIEDRIRIKRTADFGAPNF
uniref:Uncharacterized protein n=1 Tax=Romanomermis culicivorax TaxID=13658 RepID=A0A915JZV8_ROMCU